MKNPKKFRAWWYINSVILISILIIWIYRDIRGFEVGYLPQVFLFAALSSAIWEFIMRRRTS